MLLVFNKNVENEKNYTKQQIAYSEREKGLADLYHKLKASGEWTKTWNAFKCSQHSKDYYENLKSSADDKRPLADSKSASGASVPADENKSPNDGVSSSFDYNNFMDDFLRNQNMDIDSPLESSTGGPKAAGGPHGTSTVASSLISLPKSNAGDGWSMSFNTSRVMFSYAYAHTQLGEQLSKQDAFEPIYRMFLLTGCLFIYLLKNTILYLYMLKLKVFGVKSKLLA